MGPQNIERCIADPGGVWDAVAQQSSHRVWVTRVVTGYPLPYTEGVVLIMQIYSKRPPALAWAVLVVMVGVLPTVHCVHTKPNGQLDGVAAPECEKAVDVDACK